MIKFSLNTLAHIIYFCISIYIFAVTLVWFVIKKKFSVFLVFPGLIIFIILIISIMGGLLGKVVVKMNNTAKSGFIFSFCLIVSSIIHLSIIANKHSKKHKQMKKIWFIILNIFSVLLFILTLTVHLYGL
jgi:hypothetical protein